MDLSKKVFFTRRKSWRAGRRPAGGGARATGGFGTENSLEPEHVGQRYAAPSERLGGRGRPEPLDLSSDEEERAFYKKFRSHLAWSLDRWTRRHRTLKNIMEDFTGEYYWGTDSEITPYILDFLEYCADLGVPLDEKFAYKSSFEHPPNGKFYKREFPMLYFKGWLEEMGS